jgi:hypothetical protein
MKTTIAALVLAAAVASPAMAQEFIESGLPTQVAAPYTAVNVSGSHAYASSPLFGSRYHVQQRSHWNVDSYANVNSQSQNQNDIIDR